MSNFSENKINRQCAGTSAGGQFANKDHPANDGVGLTNNEDVVLSPEALQRLQDGEPTSEDSATLLKVVTNSLDSSDTDLVYL